MDSIQISRRAAERLEAGHVWVYSSELGATGGSPDGAAVWVVDAAGRSYGSALYDATASIALRLYSRKKLGFDSKLLADRIGQAREWRRRSIDEQTNAFRAVFSEADHLPGLVVDRYDRWLSVTLSSSGMEQREAEILDCLSSEYHPEGILVSRRGEARSVARGSVGEFIIYQLNGYQFQANLSLGQKTGSYLDQRENYLAVKQWVEQIRPGKFALDAFSSSGGFAIHIAKVFERVDAVDSSKLAVEVVGRNAAANGIENIRCTEADVSQYLQGMAQAKRRLDCIVLDPPAYAKSKAQRSDALRAYFDLNQRALRTLGPGAMLVTCSCSYHVTEAELLEVVGRAAAEQGREVRILAKKGQGLDHPVLLSVPESNYLKCLILYVS